MRRFFIDESVKPASLYVVEGDSLVAEAHELERAENIEATPPSPAVITAEDDHEEAAETVRPKGKKQRFCKLCGRPGHRKDGCPDAKKDTMSEEVREKLDDAPQDEQELVWDIRSHFVVQKKSPLAVCNELNITMERFDELCREYDIHR